MPASEAAKTDQIIGTALLAALREAGALALTLGKTSLKTWTKANESPVSEADIAVNDLLHQRLAPIAADYGWLSEESADDAARLSAARTWIVDPIDGTRAYLAGRPDWSISVALVENERPVIAAIFAPVEDTMFSAILNQGSRLNGTPIVVTPGESLERARIAGPKRQLDQLALLVPQIAIVPKIHSLALRLARVAQGTLDAALVSGSSHDWDLAAADLLVHEAGGRLTTIEGQPVTYNRAVTQHSALLAAGPARHTSLVRLMTDHDLTKRSE